MLVDPVLFTLAPMVYLVDAGADTRSAAKPIAQVELIRGQICVQVVHAAKSHTVRVSTVKCAHVLLMVMRLSVVAALWVYARHLHAFFVGVTHH